MWTSPRASVIAACSIASSSTWTSEPAPTVSRACPSIAASVESSLPARSEARAVVAGRPQVSFDDVETLFPDLANHRVILNFEAEAEGMATDTVLQNIIDTTVADARVAV